MAPQLDSAEQVREYLSTAFPSQEFDMVIPFEHGWVCRPQLTPEEEEQDLDLGLTSYVVNRQTGVVTVHPSLHPMTVGEMYDQAIQIGEPVQGAQIYPPRNRLDLRLLHEESTTVRYSVEIESLSEASTREFELTIDTETLDFEPTDSSAASAMSWVVWKQGRDGTWPAEGTFEE
ncbi:hypothetical protein [Nocardia vermiculata]|uniref:hypothetical protein n=1 Tax=Nocardia vermiculata TaxID=257274 RepID=UPI000834ED23|nr:hypothetical protein [Nocardia vermiculata]